MSRIFILLLSVTLTLFNNVAIARSIDEIQQSAELKVAIRDNIPPMEFIENGQLTGVDFELAEMLAQSLGVKVKPMLFKEAKEREPLLSQQSVDVVISIYSVTEDRMEFVNFSEPYFDSGSVIMIRQDDASNIKSYKDLAGKIVATTRKSVSAKTLETFIPSAITTLLPDGINRGFELLKDGKVDAVLYDKPVLDFVASKDSALYVIKEDPVDPNQYAIGLNLHDKELLDYVNHFIQEIKSNGKLKDLLKKYSTGSIDIAQTDQSITTRKYIVKKGDTLNKIALYEYSDPSLWKKIYEYNRDKITYANVINKGQELKLPELPMTKKLSEEMRSSLSGNEPTSTEDSCSDQLRELKKLKKDLTKETYREREKEILTVCKNR